MTAHARRRKEQPDYPVYPRREESVRPKLPFNDAKHPPTRPEIDILLGVLPAIELKRFEHQLELIEPGINWGMQWYATDEGWGYRGSFKARVVCVLHFYKGYFTVTLSIPDAQLEEYRSLKTLTPMLLKAFENSKPSVKTTWVTFHLHKSEDVLALVPLMEMKIADLRKKTSDR
ncbi:MAG: DUF3788 domain-containing protein [Bacteroidia bacterium]|nr:DUF3788 domain-containing protein [Bacteroidia bacterium]